jgi:hypothetical protein
MTSGSVMTGALIILFLLIVMVSGCVIPGIPGFGPVVTGTGVLITEWKPDFSRVYAGEDVTLYANVKNMGSFEANNVHLELTDLSGWSNAKLNTRECEMSSLTLMAGDVQYGTEGEEKMCSWTATAPDIDRGLHMVYKPKVMLCYDYTSTTVLRTPSISRDELKRLQDSGSGLPSQSTISSGSPISISASTPSPIIVSSARVEFPLRISVTNGGGGMFCVQGAYGTCSGSERTNSVSVKIESTTATPVNCPSEIVMFANKGEVSCDMYIGTRTETLLQNEIDITASYKYCVDASTSVEVYGS